MSFIELLQVCRWKNLLMLAFVLVLFRFTIINHVEGKQVLLTDTHFLFFLVAILLVSAAGYLINDIRDIDIDRINNPTRVLVNKDPRVIKQMYYLYLVMNTIAMIIGTDICLQYQAYKVLIIFFLAMLGLWLYAYRLKKVLLVGNLVIALLTAASILSIALFESSPNVLLSSFVLGGFAFLSTLLREYIKDVEDIEGDKQHRVLSLPVVFGVNYSKYFGFAILLSLVWSLSFIVEILIAKQIVTAAVYVGVCLIVPYFYIFYLLVKAKTKNDFSTLSTYNKIIMLLGILSVLLIYIQ